MITYYTIKDGRKVSDYTDFETARKHADEIDGDVGVACIINNRVIESTNRELADFMSKKDVSGHGFDTLKEIVDWASDPQTTLVAKVNELRWHLCTDENYPEDTSNVLIAYPDKDGNGDGWYYWMHSHCPYGWNVLCRAGAYWRKIDKPQIYER